MGLLVREGKSVRVCSCEGAKVESTRVRVVGLSVYKMLLPLTSFSIWIAAMDNIETTDGQETNGVDEILEYTIRYAQDGSYPPNLTKDKKRAVRKRAALLTVERGEVFFTRGKAKVKVLVSHDEQRRVFEGMPLRANLRPLWSDQNVQENCRTFLLEGDDS